MGEYQNAQDDNESDDTDSHGLSLYKSVFSEF
jgi:hypothetical protein